MKNIEKSIVLFCVLFVYAVVLVADVYAQVDTLPVSPRVESGKQQEDDSNDCDKESPISTYKINYITLNKYWGNDSAQAKFQFSVKYKFFDYDAHFRGRPLTLYFAYTQKSLWNVGKPSMPFEESNYNPEAFVNYNVNLSHGPVALRDIILGLEHESNGLAGPQSRSWNRVNTILRVGFWPIAKKCEDEVTQKDHVELNMKVWHASGYSDQDAYLQTIGSDKTFLGYEGHGEVNIVLRDMFAKSDWGYRIDITSKIGGKDNFEFQYQQKVPVLNFSPYVQYCYGYDETLLRFDRFGQRAFLGFAFEY